MITHTKRAMAFNPGRVQLYPRVATHLKHTRTYHTPEEKFHNSRLIIRNQLLRVFSKAQSKDFLGLGDKLVFGLKVATQGGRN